MRLHRNNEEFHRNREEVIVGIDKLGLSDDKTNIIFDRSGNLLGSWSSGEWAGELHQLFIACLLGFDIYGRMV